MVLTPHIRAGQWDNSLGYLRPRFEAFQRLVASKAIDVKLYLGSEVSLQPESLKLLSEGQIPFVGGWDSVVASDAHDTHLRPSRMREAFKFLKAHYGRQTAERLMVQGPERLLAERAMLRLDGGWLLAH